MIYHNDVELFYLQARIKIFSIRKKRKFFYGEKVKKCIKMKQVKMFFSLFLVKSPRSPWIMKLDEKKLGRASTRLFDFFIKSWSKNAF